MTSRLLSFQFIHVYLNIFSLNRCYFFKPLLLRSHTQFFLLNCVSMEFWENTILLLSLHMNELFNKNNCKMRSPLGIYSKSKKPQNKEKSAIASRCQHGHQTQFRNMAQEHIWKGFSWPLLRNSVRRNEDTKQEKRAFSFQFVIEVYFTQPLTQTKKTELHVLFRTEKKNPAP